MNENINLIELLNSCPKGAKLYSTVFGDVYFDGINITNTNYPIRVRTKGNDLIVLTKKGYLYATMENCDCILFPSKKQRDWKQWISSKLDLPIDFPVMVINDFDTECWTLRYYAGNKKVWYDGEKSDTMNKTLSFNYIIPFYKFNPNDIEESLKYNIVDNGK